MPEQTTERYCVLVNGHAVEPGCWVHGHWGQYGPDHLADRATEVGWTPETCLDDPREIRRIIDFITDCGYGRGDVHSEGVGIITALHEAAIEAADKIERWLNDHTEAAFNGMRLKEPGPGLEPNEPIFYSWGWHDGEFYLWPTETWEEQG